jgi:hypothetical protein
MTFLIKKVVASLVMPVTARLKETTVIRLTMAQLAIQHGRRVEMSH